LSALALPTLARFSILAVVIACASAGSSGASGSSPDRLTAAEIRASNATNAYELISRLRPQWLRAPGGGSISGGVVQNQTILVYLDGHRVGDLTALSTISVNGVTSMQFLDATRAPTVLNDIPRGSIAGAIVIKTS
jgi:LmbE family N-acetylglucosaminyl deacetylase